jgi:transposase-like protein
MAATYQAELPAALACFNDHFETCIAHLKFPVTHWRAIRTTNLPERLFDEERRRTKVLPHAFGERAVPKLTYAALIRAAEQWRGLGISEFELRQLKAIRDELNSAFEARTTPVTGTTVTASRSRLSSRAGT